jgi:L-asparaginase/Glu-tRNA(Gln) amidotransferase subunit D
MKKILLVFTGGTIGSVADGGTIKPSDSAPYQLLQLFQDQYPDSAAVQFDTLQPIQILSENLAPAAWKIIIAAIESAQPEIYDGIIVTHGTDTLAYTAAALGFYFNALALPLLLVSSDFPLDNSQGNGLANFMCAVEFIKQQVANGVFVAYRNNGQAMQIHLGTRLTCSLQLTGDFYSAQGKSFMQFDGQQFIPVNAALFESYTSRAQDPDEIPMRDVNLLKPEFSSHILMIKPYPGLDYSHFNLAAVDAVLHDLYHSGTACSTGQWGDNHSLVEFIKRCRDKEIPVYLAPAIQSENAYQSTRELIEHGAAVIRNMSIEAAYVKLVLAYGNYSDKPQIESFIENDLAFEHIYKLPLL